MNLNIGVLLTLAFLFDRGQILRIRETSQVEASLADLSIPILQTEIEQWAGGEGAARKLDPFPEFVVGFPECVFKHGLSGLLSLCDKLG